MFTIGDRLRKAREGLGLDRGQFAELTGISRGTIWNYETGKTKPRRTYLRLWAMATGVDLEWLRTGDAPPSQTPPGQAAGPGRQTTTAATKDRLGAAARRHWEIVHRDTKEYYEEAC